ncbi:DMT family transporter [Actinomycetospora termitidis]|uniref:DMT family transporter n=1 Tax=Actinomycetospora termitidis TaxID=3053470 RepID=A0ABT7M774_9PSEU|nr:DMT family transporter [Actinomycetospora sp. Odt1-22]MDL5156517.1 DMT family transporter [Actinomycetospora sp. Odt1-22]
MTPTRSTDRGLIVVLSVLFVLLWASGFIAAKLATRTTDVPTVLFWRFVIAAAVTGAAAAWLRPATPRGRALVHLVVTALLLQVGVFSAVFTGLSRGVPAGLTSLIVGLAPLLVGLLTPLVLRTRLGAGPVIGLLIGAVGVYVVVSGNLTGGGPVLLPVLGMAFLTAGTLYQKRFNDDTPVAASVTVQMVTSMVVLAVAMPFLSPQWLPTGTGGWLSVVWLGVVNSAGTFAVMFVLLRRRSTVHVSALLNLSPATTALLAVPFLSEALTGRAVLGLAIALVGMFVGLGTWPRRRREPVPGSSGHPVRAKGTSGR